MSESYNNTLAEVMLGNAKYIEQHLVGFVIAVVVITFVVLAVMVVWGRITSNNRNKELF